MTFHFPLVKCMLMAELDLQSLAGAMPIGTFGRSGVPSHR
jgi:hypothetical protein